MKKGWDAGALSPGRFPTTPMNGLVGAHSLFRGRMETDLSPLVSVVPSMGAHPHTDTTPRARAALRLSSSDGSTLKTLLKPLPTLSHARHHSTDAVLMRSKTPFDTASDIIRKQPPAKFLASQKGERVSALPSLAPVQKDTVEPSDARSEQSNEDECASDVTEDDSDLDEASFIDLI